MINWLKGFFFNKSAVPVNDYEPSHGYLDSYHQMAHPTKDDLQNAYHSIIYACCNLNASSVAASPWKLYVQTRNEEAPPRVATRSLSPSKKLYIKKRLGAKINKAIELDEILEHPFLDLMEYANPEQSGYELIELTQLMMEVFGDAYWWIPRGGFGIDSIWILPSQHIIIRKKPTSGEIDYYEYTGSSTHKKYRPDEVVHFKSNSLTPYSYGQGPTEATWRSNELMNKLMDYEYSLLKKGGSPDAILSLGDTMKREEKERLEARWNKRYNKDGPGGLFIADPGSKVEKLQFSPTDMKSVELSEQVVQQIANVYGVPTALLSSQMVARAQLESSLYQYAITTIEPRLRKLESVINQKILPLYDERLFLMFEPAAKADAMIEAQVRQIYTSTGILDINEVREEMGLEPKEEEKEPIINEDNENGTEPTE